MQKDEEKVFKNILLENNILTHDQVEECLKLKKESNDSKSLMVILIEKGYITPKELSKVFELGRKYIDDDGKSKKPRRLKFGELCIQRGFTTPDKIREALSFQVQKRKEGHHYRIGQILTDRRDITVEQAHEILDLQGKTILCCESCGSKFNIKNYRSTKKYHCPKCKAILVLPDSIASISVVVEKGFMTREPVEVEDDALALIGRRIGEYEIAELVGEGGMADVYKVVNPYKRKVRALKIMKSKAGVRRFTRELESAHLLKHPNIVKVYENGELEGRPYFFMEFIDGGTLAKKMEITGIIPIEIGLDILKQVAVGLNYAHQHNIIHRDIKPSNIMLSKYGEKDMVVKITDFGIARTNSDTQITVSGQLIGTFKYMSPEHIKGSAIDGKNDVFGLGIVGFEMFTGQEPFSVDAPVGYLFVNIKEEAPSVMNINPRLPKELAPIIAKMLAKEPVNRYDAESLIKDIDRFEKYLKEGGVLYEAHDRTSVYYGAQRFQTLRNIKDAFGRISRRLRRSDFMRDEEEEKTPGQGTSIISSIHKLINKHSSPGIRKQDTDSPPHLAETEAIEHSTEFKHEFQFALQLERTGDLQGAIKTLNALVERFPDSKWTEEARQKILELEKKQEFLEEDEVEEKKSSIPLARRSTISAKTPPLRKTTALPPKKAPELDESTGGEYKEKEADSSENKEDEPRPSSSSIIIEGNLKRRHQSVREAQDLLVSVKAFIDHVKTIEEYDENELWLSDVFEQFKEVDWSKAVREEVEDILYKWGRFLIDYHRKDEGKARFWEIIKHFSDSRRYGQVYEELITLEQPAGMVFVESGSFIKGEIPTESEEKEDAFFIDIYPVTNIEYQKFLKATSYKPPSYWEGDMYPVGKGNHPVTSISYQDANSYASWIGKCLPSESQWEKAARGTKGSRWPWGNTYESKRCNCREGGIGDTTPVGNYPAGKSPYGCLDMCGNVWEWTETWYDINLQNQKILKGGSWFTFEEFTMPSYRNFDYPSNVTRLYGFRCAKSFGESGKEV